MLVEYFGTFTFTGADNFCRIYHLWATVDDEDEVCMIHYGLSRDFQTACHEVRRRDCETAVRKLAFKTAEERWEAGRIDDEDEVLIVIDSDDHFSVDAIQCP